MELEDKENIKERKEKDQALFDHTKNLITNNINEKKEFKNDETYIDFSNNKNFTKKQMIINNKSRKIK